MAHALQHLEPSVGRWRLGDEKSVWLPVTTGIPGAAFGVFLFNASLKVTEGFQGNVGLDTPCELWVLEVRIYSMYASSWCNV